MYVQTQADTHFFFRTQAEAVKENLEAQLSIVDKKKEELEQDRKSTRLNSSHSSRSRMPSSA